METTTHTNAAPTATCPFGGNFPNARDVNRPLEPAPGYVHMLEEAPLHQVTLYDGSRAWLFTRHEDVVNVLSDRRFSSVPTDSYPMVSPGAAITKTIDHTFLRKDAPVHTVHRKMWTPYFAANRVEKMRPTIQSIVDRAIDRLLEKGPPADFVSEFALVIPSQVICSLLDVPESDHEFFQTNSTVMMTLSSKPEDIIAAKHAFDAYWLKEIERRELNPGDDIVSELIRTQVLTGHITGKELADMSWLMLLAGHETTASMIGLSTILLLRHPDQLADMLTDPSLTRGAVDECLRYLTVNQNGLNRVATEDVDILGTKIKKGEGIIALLSTANRDPLTFPDPQRFDIRRPTARQHVAFGAGFHQCLGNPLARVELQIVFDTLFRRMPTLQVAQDISEIDYKYQAFFFGANSFAVTW
ncbi:cytochrome P450 [Paraburkholderia sp. CNPSo 3076]|uniref:cytochrome P450 n=1 Tax=Paraburkholderia sp. CNPSo 3076 TaxID=2940936 RepID=UPI00225BE1E5|nr:cytochrome P450 [Paraburkholderia sp. CNPSo 3076]MCX5542108.1 cytochrome P450 [Paraburkholderia sp. CNPSo 3076]